MLAFAALFIVLIAETGRIPVDNPATHLELTMIHEAMILEYSGPYLALIEWSAAMKQLVLMTLLVNVFFPFGLSASWSAATVLSLVLFVVKLLLLAAAVVLVETTNAKTAAVPRSGAAGGGVCLERPGADFDVSCFEETMQLLFLARSAIRRQDDHADGGAGPGAADPDGGAALAGHQHPRLRRAVVSAGRHRRHHRLLQSCAPHLFGRGSSPWSSRPSCCLWSWSVW